MLIQANISVPCAVLDFPTREQFAREITEHRYDLIGISAIIVNLAKVREMCGMARKLSPHSTLVVGGHVTAIPGIEKMVDADHLVRGEGVSWMRRYLGEEDTAPIRHPAIVSGMRTRIMGIRLPERKGATAATIIPSVGCPMGCNFCTTSAFFGGKGKFVNFFASGDELFEVMQQVENQLKVHSFFIMDENFLLHRERATRLLERMKAARKSWTMSVFASANAIGKYTIEELVELGISWLWMGLESPRASYNKLHGTDTQQLVAELHQHGIRVLGSTIIGLEHHTPENVIGEIEHAVSHQTDFHQFMLYTPAPGTPLYEQISAAGGLLDNVDYADIHGQYKFNFKHAAISRDDSQRLLDWAFRRDFQVNGPSLYRIARTLLAGWKRYKDWPDTRVRERFAGEMHRLSGVYASALWAMERQFLKVDGKVSERIRALREEFRRESGPVSRMMPALLGPVLLWTTRREDKRLAQGKTYEPPTIVERRNWVRA